VSLRIRLLLLMLGVYCAGGYLLTRWLLDQIRPRYLESMEESMVDASVVLASILELRASTGGPDVSEFKTAFEGALHRKFDAKIFSLDKTAIDLRVYVTDVRGRVLFDSTTRSEQADFSRWNDVARTLQGKYGARSTRDIPGNDDTQVIYVAAPIRHDGRIVGVVSVGKPTRGINALVTAAKRKILIGAAGGGVVLLATLLVVASRAVAPLERLTNYARAVRDGKPGALPFLPGHTLRELGAAFEQMRDALEGRQHAERYTQALAHEVKAPLAAIRGAAELLDEEMPADQRRKFLGNIRGEAARIQRIVERLLELTSVEARKALNRTERIEVAALLSGVAETLHSAFISGGVKLTSGGGQGLVVTGERFLLTQALVNLVQNALEFSPANGEVRLRAASETGRVVFTIEDSGPGIPDFARARVFERFYSLPRPRSGQKSTGIGLALVREVAHLHGGDAMLENRPEGGARATLWMPTDRAV